MSTDGSDDDVPEEEPLFELSTEFDRSDIQRVGADLERNGDTLGELYEHESADSNPDYSHGLSGTTPPMFGRFMKMAKKGHKHKPSKKMSLGHVPKASYRDKPGLKKRPHSMITFSTEPPRVGEELSNLQQRRHTVHGVKGEKEHHRKERKARNSGGSSGSGYVSPQPSDDKGTKKKKKQESKKRRKDRDEKASFHEPSRSSASSLVVGLLSNPIDVPDFARVSSIHSEGSASFLTASLQPHIFRRDRSHGNSDRFRRARSDAHLSLPSFKSGERRSIHCPPERKQFYRHFLKALKYSGIRASVQNRLEAPPSGIHVPRQYSENLALDNPYGHMFEQLWLELQAYLSERTAEEQKEFLFYKLDHVERILNRIVNFEMPLCDPQKSLNALFCAASDTDGYGIPIPKRVLSTEAKDDEVAPGNEIVSDVTTTKQDSVESKSSGESFVCTTHEHFLSPLQLAALSKVSDLLEQLEAVEAFYPNRRRMGDEHPKYRTLMFRRRVETLTLWLKVTKGLADRLCSLSAWLGTPVIAPDVCQHPTHIQIGNTENAPMLRSLSGAHSGSPKSPKVKPQFAVGSPGSDDDLQQSLTVRSLRRMNSSLRTQSSSTSSHSQATLQRLFSNYQHTSLDENHGPYRMFVDRGLKKRGLTRLIQSLMKYIDPTLELAQFSLTQPSEEEQSDDASMNMYAEVAEERRPLLRHFLSPSVVGLEHYRQSASPVGFERATSVGPENWVQECESMNLPIFCAQYIQLVHVPLDVMHECLKLQLELRPPQQPSPHSVKQLVRECRETLERAIEVRDFYRSKIEVVIQGDIHVMKQEQIENDLEPFEQDLKCVLEVYFDYLQSWVQVSSGYVLEEEWRHVKKICTHVRGGEAEAGRRFCDMASRLLESTADILEARMDECYHILHKSGECPEKKSDMASRLLESTADILEARMDECYHILHKSGECPEKKRAAIAESCRSFKELFVEVRERASKALGFAKMLRKDLEIAADFSVQVSLPDLLSVLKSSDHAQVVLPNQRGKMMFVPDSTASRVDEILQLLNVTFAHGGPESVYDLQDSYLLLVAQDTSELVTAWNGQTVHIKASAETTIAISEIQVESLKMIVSNSASLTSSRNSFLSAVGNAVKLANEQTSSHENVAERITDLKMAACELARHLMHTAVQVTDHLSMEDTASTEDLSKPYQGTMHACFNLGFEYVREVFRLLGDDMAYQELGEDTMDYAQLWVRFVLEKCDRGRGTRPRWAANGLDFLTVACAPRMLATISHTKFEALKKLMNRCLDHVIGEAPLQPMGKVATPSPVRVSPGQWHRTPKLAYGARAFSLGTPCTRVEEEDVHKFIPEYVPRAPVQEEITQVDASPLVFKLPETEPSHAARLSSPDYLAQLAVYKDPVPDMSPPVSTESVSSGHDSLSGDIVSTVTSLTPHGSSMRPLSSVRSVERADSNTSAASASAFYSPYLRTSSESFSSDSSSGGDRMKLIQEQIKLMERNREEKLYRQKVIGRVTERQQSSLHEIAKLSNLKQTHFKWQRGRKLGEGKFGKVYECFNLDTGDVNAVKQISIQEKDTSAIQTIIDEISVFQKLSHPNVVKFYGCEVHHNELYMFMEYCNEGTLWSIAQQGLSEHMIRHYTRDILNAVYAMHERGIVHRDIKGANIFLSSNDSIKLGDFGLSVQLKNYNKTQPHEIKQQVGTVPYMPPEVILTQEMGRPMDIWSVGCVVVEMATGKLPWSEYDNQFQIMYQLGMGKSPNIARDVLSPEGHDFLSHCFASDPSKRWKANKLLDHPFVKVSNRHSSSEEDW